MDISNISSIDKQEIQGSNYKMIRSSKSIDSNEINPNSNNKGGNINATKKILITLNDNYISSNKKIKIPTHHLKKTYFEEIKPTVRTVTNLLHQKNI